MWVWLCIFIYQSLCLCNPVKWHMHKLFWQRKQAKTYIVKDDQILCLFEHPHYQAPESCTLWIVPKIRKLCSSSSIHSSSYHPPDIKTGVIRTLVHWSEVINRDSESHILINLKSSNGMDIHRVSSVGLLLEEIQQRESS